MSQGAALRFLRTASARFRAVAPHRPKPARRLPWRADRAPTSGAELAALVPRRATVYRAALPAVAPRSPHRPAPVTDCPSTPRRTRSPARPRPAPRPADAPTDRRQGRPAPSTVPARSPPARSSPSLQPVPVPRRRAASSSLPSARLAFLRSLHALQDLPRHTFRPLTHVPRRRVALPADRFGTLPCGRTTPPETRAPTALAGRPRAHKRRRTRCARTAPQDRVSRRPPFGRAALPAPAATRHKLPFSAFTNSPFVIPDSLPQPRRRTPCGRTASLRHVSRRLRQAQAALSPSTVPRPCTPQQAAHPALAGARSRPPRPPDLYGSGPAAPGYPFPAPPGPAEPRRGTTFSITARLRIQAPLPPPAPAARTSDRVRAALSDSAPAAP